MRYREIAERTLDYMVRELRLPGGGFASSQDADTEGVEGLTYTWTAEEGVPPDLLQPFEHGRSIIRGDLDEETRDRLLAIRVQRPQPPLDDKVIASWNGLALAALAEGARRLDREDLLQAARELGELLDADPLWRTMRDGRARHPAYLDDYANVAHGLIELHVATGELRWLLAARRIALEAVELFADDERGGFFLSPAGGEELVARRKELDDNPTPSGNSMLAFVLLRLARIWGDDELERRAVGVLRLVRDVMPRAPSAFGWALCALDLYLSPPREIAIVGAPEARSPVLPCAASIRALWSRSAPPRRFRSSRARVSWTESRPCTCASDSRARHRSRIRPRLPIASGCGSGSSSRRSRSPAFSLQRPSHPRGR